MYRNDQKNKEKDPGVTRQKRILAFEDRIMVYCILTDAYRLFIM